MSEMRSLTLNGKQYDCFVDSVARSMVEATALIDSAVGENIVVKNASNYDLAGLRIFGKTTQDGTPTPEAPVELVSCGDDGSITVNVAGTKETQSMIVSTPNGLHGIPVPSGGNHTDSNGKRWICDEKDFSKGTQVIRTKKTTLSPNVYKWEIGTDSQQTENTTLFYCLVTDKMEGSLNLMCDKLPVKYVTGSVNDFIGICGNPEYKLVYVRVKGVYTLDEFVSWIENNPITVVYEIATPIETPLSEEELAAYAALHTYRDSTTVSNDAGAYMELEYVMDAKKYIDSLLKASGWIANVSLPASAWKGAKSPWYQVVQIHGVTENSQVDLTPDVSQLAIFHDKDLAFVAENEDGVVTVYAVGQKPTNDYVIQATIKEVL